MWQLKNKEKVKTWIQNLRANFFSLNFIRFVFHVYQNKKGKKRKNLFLRN